MIRQAGPTSIFLKVVLQMLIGLGAAIDIGIQAARFTIDHPAGAPQHAAAAAIIHVIAYALAVAAAIELAYTLYTPGPDEALDPLNLGLSSGILLLITQDGPAVIAKFAGILLGAVALGALFFIRHRWVADEDS